MLIKPKVCKKILRLVKMKKFICLLLILCIMSGLCACGGSSTYGVQVIQTLVSQDYSIGFRLGDVTIFYIDAAIKVLNSQGVVGELSAKYFGDSKAIDFESDAEALNKIGMPEPRLLIIGIDIGSFPLSYYDANGVAWGFDIQLAEAVCDLLNWEYTFQEIETVNTYIELSSGNIDCAWGGIALDEKMVKDGKYEQLGPYIHNDIVIASRAGSGIVSRLQLGGKRMAMSTSDEAMAALQTDPKLEKRLGQIIRLTGGSQDCFQYLYDNKCDLVLTDSTALQYFNNR